MFRKLSTRACGKIFDVLVIGGGHAGCEASSAAARMGAKTLLLTHKFDTIGEMSCNPSFGGVGKAHLLHELDALDGVCPSICDQSGMHYRMLNRSNGPAVCGNWANIDRKLYKTHMQNVVGNTPNLHIKCGAVEDLLIGEGERQTVEGVILEDGELLYSKTVVIATGTFLGGQMLIGLESKPAGRMGEKASYGLSKTLKNAGFSLSRMKTGTPPRLNKKTINYSGLVKIDPDEKPKTFSFLNQNVWIEPEKQLPTFLTFTNTKVAELVHKNMHLNKHNIGEEIRGPRHCPSLESKIVKFAKTFHRIWIENEGFDSDVAYPQGISMTFPPDVQLDILRNIPGLENVEMERFGYGVQYDHVDPRQLKRSLETKIIENLFLCGQINGTTGYEEAAAQGVIAGMNAAAKVQSKDAFVPERTNSYIGVLIDDLTSLGTDEPYRMFTSRAEFRLFLRPDNADLRLTEEGHNLGAVSQKRWKQFSGFRDHFQSALEILENHSIPSENFPNLAPETANYRTTNRDPKTALHIMECYNVRLETFARVYPQLYSKFVDVPTLSERLYIEARYRQTYKAMQSDLEQVKRECALELPENLDYSTVGSLSIECKDKLSYYRPQTLAAASRIPGITPNVLLLLMKAVRKEKNRSVLLK